MPSNHIQYDAWSSEVYRRFAGTPLSTRLSENGSLASLLPSIFHRHIRDPRLATITPPLPLLPSIELRHWIELRVIPDKRFGRFHPIMLEGQPTELSKSTISIERLIQESNPVIIIGEPGSGKSTAIKWAAQQMILRRMMRPIIPIFIPLARFSAWYAENPDLSVYRFYWEHVLRLPKENADSFEDFMLLAEGESEAIRFQFQVLLDGWDEVPASRRAELLQWLERFEFTLPTTMTSRPLGYVSQLPSWNCHEIAPLTFGSMWQVISLLSTRCEQPWLADRICKHLDSNPSLRTFCRNPFVLTLIFAVASQSRVELPKARAPLYEAAIELMRQFCNSNQKDHGIHFRRTDIEQVQRVAFDLLRRTDTTPYEFKEEVLSDLTELFPKLDRARMVTATGDDDDTYRFIHATLHESLGGIGFARALADNQVAINQDGLSFAWFETLRFTFGAFPSLPDSARQRLVEWLADVCARPDRFNLILAHAANLLGEAGISYRAEELLGRDIRPNLWSAFLRSPDPKPYATAIVNIGLDYALTALDQLSSVSSDLMARVVLLYFLTPEDDPRRTHFLMQIAKPLQSKSKRGTQFAELPDLETALGYAPDEGSSVASSQEMRSAVEMIEQLAGLKSNSREKNAPNAACKDTIGRGRSLSR